MTKRLDIIIFGASGFTGKACVVEAVSVLKNFTWGIAGRNKEKLELALKYAEEETKADLSGIPILVADVENKKSLISMAERAEVIVNCCGPYRFYGEQVVQACIATGTHHVDVSGETQYMERMQLEYDELARQKEIYVVSACGMDSIPADVGTQYIENNFEGTVNSVESYFQTWNDEPQSGAFVNYGSWASLINIVANYEELKEIRSKLFKEKLPDTKPKLKTKFSIFKSALIKAHFIHFPIIDEPVVARSQRILYETQKKRPVQVKCYKSFRSLVKMICFVLMLTFIISFSKFFITRYILLTFPKIFSFGIMSRDGPTKKMMKNTKFLFTLYAEGWRKGSNLQDPPNKNLTLKISGYDPVYGATAVGALVSAITILREKHNMPSTGGVYSPGAAFGKTNIVSELGKYESGFHFEIIDA